MLKQRIKLRCLILAVLALALFAGAAGAFSPNPHEAWRYETFIGKSAGGNAFTPHAEKMIAVGDKLYGMYTSASGSYSAGYNYLATEIVEFDRELKKLRSVKLADADGNIGKNAEKMAYHDGKLYIACLGGSQRAGTFGDFWEVDTAAMTARRALDTKKISALSGKPNVLPYGISIAGDGTAFLLCLTYEADWTTSVKLFVTDVNKLVAGNAGTAIDIVGSGYSWDVQYDDTAGVLWCMAGTALQARDKTGALIRAFTPADLGNNIGTIAVLADTGAGKPGLFYTAVADDYSSGSTGIVTKNTAATFLVEQLTANYTSDIRGYAFKDPDNAPRVLMRETPYGGTDTLFVWDIRNWANPILNVHENASANIHDAFADGQYLYLATYSSAGANGVSDPRGEFVRLDMKNGYRRDKNYLLDYGYEMGDIGVIVPTLPSGAGASVEVLPVSASLAASRDSVATAVGFDAKDLDVVGGNLVLSKDVAMQQAGQLLGADIDTVVPLPVFTTTTSAAGNIAAVGFKVTGEELLAGRAADVRVVKVRGKDQAPLAFAYESDPARYADGTFTVLNGSTAAEALTAATEYTLVLFIEDDGDYDLDPAERSILDPAVIVKTVPDSSGDSGGGGGCDVGGAAALALLAAVTLLRRTRRCCEKK